MKQRDAMLKIVLALVCIVNLSLGIIAFTSQPLLLKAINIIYGVQLPSFEEHVVYIVKMLGCFLIAISVMTGLAIRNPYENRIVIYGNIIWLTLRGIQRITYVERFHRDWGIPYVNLWGQVIFVFLFALVLFLLMPKKNKA